MTLGRCISGLDKIVAALDCGDGFEDVADGVADGILAAGGGLAEPVLELGEKLLDRVEVWRVFREQEEPGAGGADGAPDRGALVRAEVSMTTISPGRSVGTRTRSR
jgi:hypothetical protein